MWFEIDLGKTSDILQRSNKNVYSAAQLISRMANQL